MKKGEKIFFGVSVVIAILAIGSVTSRIMSKSGGHSPKDYYEWADGAKEGYVLYKKSGCNSCHRALRMGEAGVAPVLDGIGTRKTEEWLADYFKNPESVVPGSAHTGKLGPDFRALSAEHKKLFVAFLKGLKSSPGSSNYPIPPFEFTKTERMKQ